MITAEDLEKLAELKEKGILTEEEFNAKRDEYLQQDTEPKTKTTKSRKKATTSEEQTAAAIRKIMKNNKQSKPKTEDTSSGIGVFGWIIVVLAVLGLFSFCGSMNERQTVYYCGGVGSATTALAEGAYAGAQTGVEYAQKCKIIYGGNRENGGSFDIDEYNYYAGKGVDAAKRTCYVNPNGSECSNLVSKCLNIVNRVNDTVAAILRQYN